MNVGSEPPAEEEIADADYGLGDNGARSEEEGKGEGGAMCNEPKYGGDVEEGIWDIASPRSGPLISRTSAEHSRFEQSSATSEHEVDPVFVVDSSIFDRRWHQDLASEGTPNFGMVGMEIIYSKASTSGGVPLLVCGSARSNVEQQADEDSKKALVLVTNKDEYDLLSIEPLVVRPILTVVSPSQYDKVVLDNCMTSAQLGSAGTRRGKNSVKSPLVPRRLPKLSQCAKSPFMNPNDGTKLRTASVDAELVKFLRIRSRTRFRGSSDGNEIYVEAEDKFVTKGELYAVVSARGKLTAGFVQMAVWMLTREWITRDSDKMCYVMHPLFSIASAWSAREKDTKKFKKKGKGKAAASTTQVMEIQISCWHRRFVDWLRKDVKLTSYTLEHWSALCISFLYEKIIVFDSVHVMNSPHTKAVLDMMTWLWHIHAHGHRDVGRRIFVTCFALATGYGCCKRARGTACGEACAKQQV